MSPPTDQGSAVSTVVRFDVRALRQSAALGRGVSVAETVALVVDPGSEPEQVWRIPIGRLDSVVSQKIEIPRGTAIFTASVISNNGTLLYSGDTVQRVERDGFKVEVPLDNTHSPVLAAFPDSVTFEIADSIATVTVVNRGRDTLAWGVIGISPAETCSVTGAACFTWTPKGGSVAAGQPADTIELQRHPSTPKKLYTLGFASGVGSVVVRVLVR